MEVVLVTGRTIYQGVEMEKGKLSPDYWETVRACFLDPDDAKELGVGDGDPIRVSTPFGSIVLTARIVRGGRQRGIVFVPLGPWANILVDPETHGIGMPSLKGVRATIEPAPGEKPMDLAELLEHFYGPMGR